MNTNKLRFFVLLSEIMNNFLCSECTLKFPSYKRLNDHFKVEHYGFELRLYCPFTNCVKQSFTYKKCLENHIKKFHGINTIRYNNLPVIEAQITTEIENPQPFYEDPPHLIDQPIIINNQPEPVYIHNADKLSDLLDQFKENMFHLALNTYSNPSLPMNAAEQILSEISNLLITPFMEIVLELQPKLQTTLQKLKDEFENVSTEHRFLKILEKKKIYKKPKPVILQEYFSEKVSKGRTFIGKVQEKCVVMNVESQIRLFLETPGIYKLMMEYSEEQRHVERVESYLSGDHWKKKYDHTKPLAIDLYNDDFEVNNPLGTKAGVNSLTGFYYSFANLPPYLSSRLNNIFVVLIVESKLFKDADNMDICSQVLEKIINNLGTEGVQIKVDGILKKVYFKLGMWKGDNLGLNKSLGFSPGFNANLYCRVCRILRTIAQKKCDLIGVELRTIENYNSDLGKPFKLSGIAFETKLNEIKDFHATDNGFLDKMHDWEEGVAPDSIELILNHFILKKKYFTIKRLNYIKKFFNYGEIDIKNRSVPFKTVIRIVGKKRVKTIRVKTSATEMACLLKYLPLMISHLVPQRDPVWKFLLTVVKVSEFLNLSSYSEMDIRNLRLAITHHHKTLLRLFPKKKLKPKHHFLLHYPDLIKQMGSPKKNNCFMYEMKHKTLKKVAKTVNTRRFLPLTIAKKLALQNSKLTYDRLHSETSEFTNLKPMKSSSISEEDKTLIASNFEQTTPTYFSKITFREHLYKVGQIIAQNKSTFYRITALFKVSDKYYLSLKKLRTVLNNNSTFYRITGADNRSVLEFSRINSFPLNSNSVRGVEYIKSKLF